MRRLLAIGLLALLAIPALARPRTYLIIPFENVSGRPDLDWIGESLAETMRDALGSYNLPSVSREEREAAAHQLALPPSGRMTKASVIELGRQADADVVVFGRFEIELADEAGPPAEGNLTIRAESIDLVRTNRGPVWVETGAMAELSRLQSTLGWRLLQFAAPDDTSARDEFLENHPPVRIDAIENYIRGLLAPDLEQKHRYFTLAVNLEPEFSQPCFQLGQMQWEENSYRVAAQWLERVKPSDARYMEANFLLGLARYHSGDHAGALAAFELVANAIPLEQVYNNLALAQFREGIPNAAIESLLWVLNRVPSDPDYHFNLGYMIWRQGDVDGAAEHFATALELDPHDVDAQELLERSNNGQGPRRGDLSGEGLERLKEDFSVDAYRSLLAAAEPEIR
jgi:tetratricopeptide (TPR) repeat protein